MNKNQSICNEKIPDSCKAHAATAQLRNNLELGSYRHHYCVLVILGNPGNADGKDMRPTCRCLPKVIHGRLSQLHLRASSGGQTC